MSSDNPLPWLKPWWGGWQHVVMRDPCVYCGGKSTTIEHVIARHGTRPRRIAQPDTVIVGACRQCNADRGSMPMMLYLTLRCLRGDERLNTQRQALGLPTFARILRSLRNPRRQR